jgi:hypothetical protein
MKGKARFLGLDVHAETIAIRGCGAETEAPEEVAVSALMVVLMLPLPSVRL